MTTGLLGGAFDPPHVGHVVLAREAVDRFAARVGDTVAVVGFVEDDGDVLHNAAAVCVRGEVVGVYRRL